ncbi:MAG: polysaccharide pyruvyl transferase family protein [Acidimicrobiales bacterium]
MKRSAVLEGYFGMHNVGDDAFCVVAASVLSERLGFDHLAVVAPHDALPILPALARGMLPRSARTRGHVRAATVAGKLRHRLVLHTGGSTLRQMNQRRCDEALLQRTGSISCHALSVSVGPFRNCADEWSIREFLKRFRSISLRDAASFERAKAMSLDVPLSRSFDLAVLAPDHMQTVARRSQRARPRLGVALRLFESFEGGSIEMEQRRILGTIGLLKAVAKLVDYEPVLLAFNCHPSKGDVGLANMIADEMQAVTPCTVEPYERDVSSMLSAVASCDAVLAMRLHAGVFAYATGVPFAIIDYHPKCADFAESVGLTPELVFAGDGSDLVDQAERIASLLSNGGPPLLSLDTARYMALEGFDLLGAHLDG